MTRSSEWNYVIFVDVVSALLRRHTGCYLVSDTTWLFISNYMLRSERESEKERGSERIDKMKISSKRFHAIFVSISYVLHMESFHLGSTS